MSTPATKHRACVRSSSSSPRDRLIVASLLLGPALAALGWDAFGPGGPSAAQAAPLEQTINPALLAGLKVRKATDEESEARAYCEGLCAEDTKYTTPMQLPMVDGTAGDELADSPLMSGVAAPSVRIA